MAGALRDTPSGSWLKDSAVSFEVPEARPAIPVTPDKYSVHLLGQLKGDSARIMPAGRMVALLSGTYALHEEHSQKEN